VKAFRAATECSERHASWQLEVEQANGALSAAADTIQCNQRAAAYFVARTGRTAAPLGYRRLHVLLQREVWVVNSKRIYRIYVEERLVVRRKRRRGIAPSRACCWLSQCEATRLGRWTFCNRWAYENKIVLHFIKLGRLMENGYTESFHGKFREDASTNTGFSHGTMRGRRLKAGGSTTIRCAHRVPWAI
jgi:hypothetical protein